MQSRVWCDTHAPSKLISLRLKKRFDVPFGGAELGCGLDLMQVLFLTVPAWCRVCSVGFFIFVWHLRSPVPLIHTLDWRCETLGYEYNSIWLFIYFNATMIVSET